MCAHGRCGGRERAAGYLALQLLDPLAGGGGLLAQLGRVAAQGVELRRVVGHGRAQPRDLLPQLGVVLFRCVQVLRRTVRSLKASVRFFFTRMLSVFVFVCCQMS